MGDPDYWGRKQYIIGVISLVVTLGGFSIYDFLQDDPNPTPASIPTEPPSSTGSISVTSSPIGASIFLDDTYEGETPKILEDVKQGSHTVALTLAEYKDWSQDISVDADKTVSVSPTLTPSPEPSPEPSSSTGSISVTSSPTGASIFLGDTYEGETPKILDDVKQGFHTVTLTLAEYEDWSKAISVEADKTVSISHILTPNTSSDSQESETVDISPYFDWSFTTSDSASYNAVPEGDSYVTVTIHIKNEGDVPISTHESCWIFTSNGVPYNYTQDISIALHRNYEMLEVNPGEETTFKVYYLVKGVPTTASLSYINPYTDV